ncbi:MAG: ATP-binding protein [Candidatus Aminicenantes bacterium]|nr:ATP-binding protein [Candidatus Aminicenantes bacterium]
MKIAKVHLKDHPLFGTMDFDFTGPDGKTLDTVVIAGVNGTGKTTLLDAIREMLHIFARKYEGNSIELDFSTLYEKKLLNKPMGKFTKDRSAEYHQQITDDIQIPGLASELDDIIESERPKIIYMPTEINFTKLAAKTLSYSVPKFGISVVIDQDVIADVPSFIASSINSEVYKNPDLPAKNAIDKICREINSLFDILAIDAQIIGLNPDKEKLPKFKNSAGSVFDINHLSSGEKQLFVRAMALKMLNANNSVILIDEPEISMHPGWQQRIVKVYEQIGNNNQVIIATHSPFIVGSVPKESVKLLKRVNGQIKVVEYNEISGSYGLPVDIVLRELMDLDTVRAPEVDKEIKSLWDMLYQKQHDTKEFNEKYRQLEQFLGSEDEDLLLMRIEIAKLKVEKGKPNAGNKKG